MFAFGIISNEVKAGIYTYILVYVAFTRSYSVGAFFLASFFFFLFRKKLAELLAVLPALFRRLCFFFFLLSRRYLSSGSNPLLLICCLYTLQTDYVQTLLSFLLLSFF